MLFVVRVWTVNRGTFFLRTSVGLPGPFVNSISRETKKQLYLLVSTFSVSVDKGAGDFEGSLPKKGASINCPDPVAKSVQKKRIPLNVWTSSNARMYV